MPLQKCKIAEHLLIPCTAMSPAPLKGKAMFIISPKLRCMIEMPALYWKLVLWGHCVWISNHLEYFFINRNLNWKKVSFSKPPPTPFRQSPPMQQGSWEPSFQRGKDKQTNVVLKRLPERRQRKTERRQSTVSFNNLWKTGKNIHSAHN